jgi:uncharacterized protein (DUF58 family)
MEYHYQVPWLARSPRPGRHRSGQVGSGMIANRSVPLHSGADLRRLDIRARMADPMRRWWVRETLQRDAINVWLLADVSTSLSFGSNDTQCNAAFDLLRDFATATAQSAFRSGDAFGLIAADDQMRDELSLALSRRAGTREIVKTSLSSPDVLHARAGASALSHCAEQMSARKSLVFLVSDFLLTPEAIDHTLDSLAHHHVIPVILPTHDALDNLPRYGWVTFNDLESGQKRSLLLRPSLHDKLREAAKAHDAALLKVFARHGVVPLRLTSPFNADQVTDYFFEAMF